MCLTVKDSDDGSVQQGVLPYSSLPGSQGWKVGMPFQRLHLGVSFGMTTVDQVTVLQDVVRVLSYRLTVLCPWQLEHTGPSSQGVK